MSVFDIYNIENYTPKNPAFSWLTHIGTLIGFVLGLSFQVVLYYVQVARSGKLFRVELRDSENAFWEQLTSIHNFKKEIRENRPHNLSLWLRQKYKTLLHIDRVRLIAYYRKRWYLPWRKGKESNYITNTLGQIENTVAQMERLDKFVTDFNSEYKDYMKEYVDLHFAIKHHYDMLRAKGKSNATMAYFASLYENTFFIGTEKKDHKIIDLALLEDTAMTYHLMLEDKLPYDKDEEFFNIAMEYSYKARTIITHLSHCKSQVLADVSLIEITLKETYEQIFDRKFNLEQKPKEK